MNREYARAIIQNLLKWGVCEFYVCAGARNFPLVETVLGIKHNKKIVFNHFEERAASFYALGRIKSLKKPVAVITTSGTAVGELLPAVMEACYSGLPLVLITADRPRSYRGTGAPQSAEQANIFGSYVSHCMDLEYPELLNIAAIPKNKPLHINVCFDVPLQSGTNLPLELKDYLPVANVNLVQQLYSKNTSTKENKIEQDFQKFQNFLKNIRRSFVIVSQIATHQTSNLINFLLALNVPVYCESISNLRECEALSQLRIHCADNIWSNAQKSNLEFDAVLKIGGTPTHRVWRDLDEIKKDIQVFSISELPFSGMSHAQHIQTDLDLFFDFASSACAQDMQNKCIPEEMEKFLLADKEDFKLMAQLVKKYPNAEQSFFYHLSNHIGEKARIYLGNSLPIRYWDLTASFQNKKQNIEASRGLNGIDGQLSTFLGFADDSNQENWGIFGDLTTLYDLSALWMLRHRPRLNMNIVIINNAGGQIFSRVLKGKNAEFCQNAHHLNFRAFAKMWGINYMKITSSKQIPKIPKSSQNIIEIVPNAKHSGFFLTELL